MGKTIIKKGDFNGYVFDDDCIISCVNRSCRNSSGGSQQLDFNINLSGLDIASIIKPAISSLVIKLQKQIEKMSPSEQLEKVDGKTFHASTIGKKIETKEDKIASLIASLGIEREVAEYIVDNPSVLNKVME